MLDRNDKHFDALETRSADERAADQLVKLNAQLASNGMAAVAGLEELAGLPVLRKSDLVARQAEAPPFGGLPVSNLAHVFQSPGPIYEPGGVSHDWWRMGRFLHAVGIGRATSCRTVSAIT
jgi:phenylacetate-CoA ligase